MYILEFWWFGVYILEFVGLYLASFVAMKDEEKRSEAFMSQQGSKITINKLIDQASLGINNIKFFPKQSIKTTYDDEGSVEFEKIESWYYDPTLQKTSWVERTSPTDDGADGLMWVSKDGTNYPFRQNAFTIEKKNIAQSGTDSYSKYYFARCINLEELATAGGTTDDLVPESFIDEADTFFDAVNYYPVYEKLSTGTGDDADVTYRVKCCEAPLGVNAFDPATCSRYIDKPENDKYRPRIFVAYRKTDTSPDILKMYPSKGELKHTAGAGFAVYFNHNEEPDIAYIHSYLLVNKCQVDSRNTNYTIPVADRKCQWGSRFYANYFQRKI